MIREKKRGCRIPYKGGNSSSFDSRCRGEISAASIQVVDALLRAVDAGPVAVELLDAHIGQRVFGQVPEDIRTDGDGLTAGE